MQAAQQTELEAMTDMFNKCVCSPAFSKNVPTFRVPSQKNAANARYTARRMTEQCFRKCVAMYKEPELSVGEATCVDRCVHKYMTSHSKVQEILSKHAANAAQQQQIG